MNGSIEWAVVGSAAALVIGGWTVLCYALARWIDERNAENAIKARQWLEELAPPDCGQFSIHKPHVFADDDAQHELLHCPGVPR